MRLHRIRKVQAPKRRSVAGRAGSGLSGAAESAQAAAAATSPIATAMNKNDLDSSNVLYDADFEIEEEKLNESTSAFPMNPNTTNIFNR